MRPVAKPSFTSLQIGNTSRKSCAGNLCEYEIEDNNENLTEPDNTSLDQGVGILA